MINSNSQFHAFCAMFKSESLLSIRGGDMLLFGCIMPAAIVLLIGFVASPETLASSFSAIASIGMLASGLMGIPLTVSNYRHAKILKRYCVTPISPFMLLSANALYQVLFTAISALIVILIAVLGFNVSVANWGKFATSFVFAIFVTFSFGCLIASVSPNIKTTNNLCSLFYFPALFLSGSTVPFAIMPRGLQIVTYIFPVTHTNLLMESAASGVAVSFGAVRIIVLSLIAIIAYGISVRKFRWE